jgi:Mg2+ and Co2+ transporter CorA
LTIYAYIISKQTIKQVNISDPLTLRKEMIENPEESLWIHADEPANIFHLQDIFGLHPLAVDAIVHRNQPSKVEEYGRYLFRPTKSQLSDIILIRRKLGFMESTLAMISRAFEDVISGVVQTTRLGNDSTRQIRSLNDRVVYLQNSVENMHQRVINLREAYNSSLSADLNETIRTLTVIATIILPLTLIAGIYGMNFDVIPELHSPFGYYYALSLMAAVAGSMIIYFRKKKWI